jgi:hypothetical protein
MDEDESLDRQRDFEKHLGLPAGTFMRKVDFQHPESMNALKGEAMAELADMIGPNDLNIIDYLEITDQFYRVGEALRLLRSRLERGVLMVFLQKAPGKDDGLGGMHNLSLSRLAFTMDYDEEAGAGVLRFRKVKKPTIKGSRPEDTELLYWRKEDATDLIFKGTRPRTKPVGGKDKARKTDGGK